MVLFFSISSISAQSLNADDVCDNNKVLKSDSSSGKISAATKVKANSTKQTSKTNTAKTANTTKQTSKTSTVKTANTTKKTTASVTKAKTKENTTTVNKKTLAKTSTSFMNYVEKNGKFPKVKISNKNYSNTEYLYLMTKAVENNSNTKIEINRKLVKKYNNTNSKSVNGTLNKTEYVKIAGKTRKFIEKNKRAPNWVSSSKGNIPYNQLILSYSKCLDFFNKNDRMPNSIRLDDLDLDKINSKINKNKTKSTSNTSVKSTNKTATNSVKTNASKNKTTSNSVKTNASKTKTDTSNTSSNKEENGAEDGSLVERTLNNVHNILNKILDRLDPSKYTVDVTKSDEGNVKVNTSKINVDINGKSSVNVQVSAKNTSNKTTASSTKKTNATKTSTNKTATSSTKKTNATKASVSKSASKTVRANKTSIAESLKKYLKSTKNCQVKNKSIQDLAKTLTSSLKSDYEKGKKLFNWVRDNIQYKKYRNTRRGAVKTLQSKKGNCVDQSHLLIALSRASGIPARYVKGGNCKFTTGYVSGHIWTQMYLNNKWVVADTTSSRNSLGKIRNWDTKNYKLYGEFSSISF